MLKQLAVLYLFSSFILLTSAVPSSRSLMSSVEDNSVLHSVAQEESTGGNGGDGLFEGRMDFELDDYPKPGPNPRHDPKVPPASE